MEIEEYNLYKSELENKILPLLVQKVFHYTRYSSYLRIFEDGFIDTNQNGKYGFNWSENSYGRKRGYICLFDLRNTTEKILNNALECFNFLGNHAFGNKFVYLILKEELYSDLIDYQQAYSETEGKEKYIPKVECWYPNPIHLQKIQKVIVVNLINE